MYNAVMKSCKKCKHTKMLSEFYRQKENKDGHHGSCKQCMNEVARRWWSARPDLCREKSLSRNLSEARRKRRNKTVDNRKRPYLKFKGSECRRCGFIPEKACQLSVDHIDGEHQNNNASNLQTLCHNCHNLKTYVERFEPDKLLLLNLIPGTGTP